MDYFSISSGIFSLGLSPSELMTFCAVSSIKNQLSFAVCSAKALSARTGMSVRTIRRALDGLQARGLLRRSDRRRYDGSRAANGYTVSRVSGGMFKVSRSIWRHMLDAGSFMVYLFLTKKMDNRTRVAYPSLHKIAGALRICKNTVIAKIRLLQQRLLIDKTHQRRKHGGFACNRHWLWAGADAVLDCFKAKKKERRQMRSFYNRSLHSTTTFRARTESFFSLARLRGVFKRATAFLRKFTLF